MDIAANHETSKETGQEQNNNYLTEPFETSSSRVRVGAYANHQPRQ
jgi:hypothetical protein